MKTLILIMAGLLANAAQAGVVTLSPGQTALGGADVTGLVAQDTVTPYTSSPYYQPFSLGYYLLGVGIYTGAFLEVDISKVQPGTDLLVTFTGSNGQSIAQEFTLTPAAHARLFINEDSGLLDLNSPFVIAISDISGAVTISSLTVTDVTAFWDSYAGAAYYPPAYQDYALVMPIAVSLSQVPEPDSLALVAACALSVGFAASHRSRNQMLGFDGNRSETHARCKS